MTLSIRLATKADMPRVVELIEAHAAFERSGPVTGTADRLGELLIDEGAATCFVATVDDHVVGYATAAPEFSTWSAEHYLHMDTLFVDEQFRGQRIGQRLFDAVIDHGTSNGFSHVQWQTPDWNLDAIRFYKRAGATSTSKQRFTLECGRQAD